MIRRSIPIASISFCLERAGTTVWTMCRETKTIFDAADGSDGSCDALTSRGEMFDGDGCRHDSHRAKIHDPEDQENRHQTATTVAAVETQAQAVSPGRAGVGRQGTAAPGRRPAAGKVARLPR